MSLYLQLKAHHEKLGTSIDKLSSTLEQLELLETPPPKLHNSPNSKQ
jgi:hypothetical protein